ncbi:MAG: hypothetical protein AB3X41_09430 [Leptothrix ochracea]|uniref:hypothetical protein n=1 Tax=Leptothrix ochracea TaxID=735331 RepID=UPI0034E1EA9F
MKTSIIRLVRRSGLLLGWLATLGGCAIGPNQGYRHATYSQYVEPAPQVVTAPPPSVSASATMYFYPERNQSEATQDRDRFECYRWAVKQTGVDPGMTATRQEPPPPVGTVQRDEGAVVVGAVTGAAVGSIMSGPRRGGEGMVLGAIFGAVMGAAAEDGRARRVERVQEARRRDWEARQAPTDDFRRAMSACMSGRGYAVR